ncbi:hypothetical protein [Bilophila wadsworthia]
METVGNNDEMLIEVELSDLFTDDYSVLQRLTKEITRDLFNHPTARAGVP